MTDPLLLWVGLALGALNAALLLWLLLRQPPGDETAQARGQQLLALLQNQGQQTAQRIEHVEGELRREIAEHARGGRIEVQQTLATFQETISRQGAEATRTQNAQLDAFAQQLLQLRGTLGDTLTQQLQAISLGMGQQAAEATRTQNAQIDAFAQQLVQLRGTLGDTLTAQLQALSESNARRLAEVRATLEQQLAQLQQNNATKLDEMRATVDEKLHATLETRLGERFKQVAERLEQVHRGLGEMQTLAQGVGDLKHLLTNVKTRGMFGEAQLASLLEQVFAPDQYATQVATRPGSRNVVDFAIRLPGRGDDGAPCWLPIDAKFPNED
jgi:DNA recombination protein RmuC